MNENEFLANVAGLTLRKPEKHPSNPSFYYLNGKLFCIDSDWNPYENLEQAMMLLDKFPDNDIDINWNKDDKLWCVSLWIDDRTSINTDNGLLAHAIVDAVLQAKGYEK